MRHSIMSKCYRYLPGQLFVLQYQHRKKTGKNSVQKIKQDLFVRSQRGNAKQIFCIFRLAGRLFSCFKHNPKLLSNMVCPSKVFRVFEFYGFRYHYVTLLFSSSDKKRITIIQEGVKLYFKLKRDPKENNQKSDVGEFEQDFFFLLEISISSTHLKNPGILNCIRLILSHIAIKMGLTCKHQIFELAFPIYLPLFCGMGR